MANVTSPIETGIWVAYPSNHPSQGPSMLPIIVELSEELTMEQAAERLIKLLYGERTKLLNPQHTADVYKSWQFSVERETEDSYLGKGRQTSWIYINFLKPNHFID